MNATLSGKDAMSHIHEINTRNRAQVRRFLDFPFRLYQDCPRWVPPMAGDARLQLDRQRHPYYRHSDASFFLATTNGETVGRIAVLEHRRYSNATRAQAKPNLSQQGQSDRPKGDAFFYLFEAVDDAEVSQALFKASEAWARQRGLAYLIGPLGFAAGDPLGLLVEGFEHRAAMGISYNYDYYGPLVEAHGYRKDFDLLSYHLTDQMQFPEKIHYLAEQVKRRRKFRIVTFRSKRELRTLIPRIKQLYNQTLGAFEGNAPLTEAEIDAVAERMISVAEPQLIKVVMRGEEMVGFLFAFPNLSATIQRCKGRLWPLGWLWLLREYKRTRWVDLNGMAVVPKYQGLGVNLVLYSEMAKTLQTGRFTDADLVQVRDHNLKMIAEMERLGAPIYKRHRVYRKSLITPNTAPGPIQQPSPMVTSPNTSDEGCT
jgi:GNAT superfamily N-acetyltransferase